MTNRVIPAEVVTNPDRMIGRALLYPTGRHYVLGTSYDAMREGVFAELVSCAESRGISFEFVRRPSPRLKLSNGAVIRSQTVQDVLRLRGLDIQTLLPDDEARWTRQAKRIAWSGVHEGVLSESEGREQQAKTVIAAMDFAVMFPLELSTDEAVAQWKAKLDAGEIDTYVYNAGLKFVITRERSVSDLRRAFFAEHPAATREEAYWAGYQAGSEEA